MSERNNAPSPDDPAAPGQGGEPGPEADGRPGRSLLGDANLHVIFGITLMAVLGVSSITPVFPQVAEELGIPPSSVGLLITAYALPGIVLMPILGVLADRLGRKQVLVPALLLFAVAGTACAFARDFRLLLGLRFLQGMGGASLGSLTATLIGDLYRDRERTRAMGYKASILSLGSAVYPALGGALALLGWYVPFALPILGLVVAWAVLSRLNAPVMGRPGGFRAYVGEAAEGMRQKKVLGLYLATLVSFCVLYGAYMTFVPLHLAASFQSSAPAIGLVMSVGSLTTALTSSLLGSLNRFLARERLLLGAFVLFALSLFMIPRLPAYGWVVVAVGLFGIGQGLNYPVVLSLLAGFAPTQHRAIFMSVNGTVIRMGQALGPVAMGAVAAWKGVDGVFLVGAWASAAMVVVLPILVRGGPRRRSGGPEEEG